MCLVFPNLIVFDPATLTLDYSFWTLLTCHLASTSIFELFIFLLFTNYLINQVEQTWTLKRFALTFLASSLFQSLTYWCFWAASNWIIPRRWILGDSAFMCGFSSLMIFLAMIIRMEQPQRQIQTTVPAVTGYLKMNFAYLPQVLSGTYLFCSFLLEQPFI